MRFNGEVGDVSTVDFDVFYTNLYVIYTLLLTCVYRWVFHVFTGLFGRVLAACFDVFYQHVLVRLTGVF